MTIVYFCYGAIELYHQTRFSIASLLRVADNPAIIVYCDRPAEFGDLPVRTVALDAATLSRWLGDSDYIHRRKTCVILDALKRNGGKVLFLDSDTYWTASPRRLERRIGPDRACFHLREGYLLSTGTPFDAALAAQLLAGDYRLRSGQAVAIGRRTPMWNTGVVGVHEAQFDRISAALELSDRIWQRADPDGPYGRKIHHAEQFAMGYAFKDCRIAEAADCVHHYWPSQAKQAFAPILARLVGSAPINLSPDGLAHIYRHRYCEHGRAAAIERFKMLVRKSALALELPVRGVRRSV